MQTSRRIFVCLSMGRVSLLYNDWNLVCLSPVESFSDYLVSCLRPLPKSRMTFSESNQDNIAMAREINLKIGWHYFFWLSSPVGRCQIYFRALSLLCRSRGSTYSGEEVCWRIRKCGFVLLTQFHHRWRRHPLKSILDRQLAGHKEKFLSLPLWGKW